MEQLHYKASPVPFFGFDGTDHFDSERVFREHGTLRRFRKHSLLYSPGDDASQVYLIAEGEVRVSRYTAEGRELTLDHMRAGEVCGETEILLGTSREAQAQARTETLVYTLEREALFRLIESESRFGMWLSCIMSARQARMEKRLESLLFKSANGKVAQVLVRLAEEYGQRTQGGTLIDYPITHQEIGNMIATTRETVSYAFMEFRQRGLITTRQRKTIVHDLDELELVALT